MLLVTQLGSNSTSDWRQLLHYIKVCKFKTLLEAFTFIHPFDIITLLLDYLQTTGFDVMPTLGIIHEDITWSDKISCDFYPVYTLQQQSSLVIEMKN